MAVDDQGKAFTLSSDPLLDTVCLYVKDIQLGDTVDAATVLKPILENKKIFGVDLYEIGMAEKVCQYFTEFIAGPGAVQKTLEKYVS